MACLAIASDSRRVSPCPTPMDRVTLILSLVWIDRTRSRISNRPATICSRWRSSSSTMKRSLPYLRRIPEVAPTQSSRMVSTRPVIWRPLAVPDVLHDLLDVVYVDHHHGGAAEGVFLGDLLQVGVVHIVQDVQGRIPHPDGAGIDSIAPAPVFHVEKAFFASSFVPAPPSTVSTGSPNSSPPSSTWLRKGSLYQRTSPCSLATTTGCGNRARASRFVWSRCPEIRVRYRPISAFSG